MFSTLHLTALAVPVLAAASLGWTALAHTPEPEVQSAISCSIAMTPHAGMLRIEGRGTAGDHIRGTYHFDVERAGARLSQSGPFDLRPDEDVAFGQITLNGPRQSIDATLTLTFDETVLTCPGSI